MRILLINEYYPPDTSATAHMAEVVVRTLAARHEVTVLAGRPSYDPTERYPWKLLRRDKKENVTVERVGSTTYPRFRMRRRVTNYLTYLALAVPRALFIRADLVLAMTDPPIAGIAAAFVAMLKRRPFVYNIRDLYPDMAVGGEIVRPSRWVRLWERMHRWALRRAARVIVLGADMRDRIVAKGVDPERVVIVRDGAPIPTTLGSAEHPSVRDIRDGFSFVALHAGNLGFYGAWDSMVEAARRVAGDGIGLVFVGDGAHRDRLMERVVGRDSIRFLPFRPASDVPHVLAAADVHVVTVKRGLEGVVVPSKLYPVLAAGRPVLAITPEESDVARIVRRAGCGLVADPDDPQAVADALVEMKRDPERLAEMGRRAREISLQYERSTQLQLFAQIFDDLGRFAASRNGTK